MQPVIAIHGGAGDIPDELVAGHAQGVRRAAVIGLDLLNQGASAEDAVEAAIRYMEDDETFDAGRGSFLNQDGDIELDASFMEGRDLDAGAVAGVRDIANPISLARLVMKSE
ncbi:MAG: isoaspartyl peptidase/L-asparaginase, partial [Chloroflexi bacterium]|nr:isoaspartyl peptidase/L-asparaginase [Chloroflexota bacterium]